MRKIIHIDMDAFYAAVEQRDNPQYRGLPIVVGGKPNSRGVVATASYEARRFGIHSAMPSSQAFRLCPKAIFVSPRFDAYQEVSSQVMEILRSYTELVEALSLDEAYLDVSLLQPRYAREIAQEIKERIRNQTGLTASAGVAENKFLAKVASDFRKPDGLTVITPEIAPQFLAKLTVRRIPGVGPVTEAKLNQAGIYSIADLQQRPQAQLQELFGSFGAWLANAAYGKDDSPVEPEHVRKSLSTEETFAKDLVSFEEMQPPLSELAESVSEQLKDLEIMGRTVTLKVTFHDFSKITRRVTLERCLQNRVEIADIACQLLKRIDLSNRSVRLLGVGISNFVLPDEAGPVQLSFPFMVP